MTITDFVLATKELLKIMYKGYLGLYRSSSWILHKCFVHCPKYITDMLLLAHIMMTTANGKS